MAAKSKKRLFRKALACLCVMAMGCLMLFGPPASSAFAKQGTFTVAGAQSDGATYEAYQVFVADVNQDGTASNITWADDAVREAVLPYLDGQGYGDWLNEHHPGEGQREMAQNAAEFITSMMGGQPTVEDQEKTSQPTGADFSNGLARAVDSCSTTQPQQVVAGEPFTADQGLWLLVSSDAENTEKAGTAPLWVPVSDTAMEIADKSSTPTIDKQVREDSDKAWGKVADANRGQDLEFNLIGTMPDNLSSYSHYHYRFVDHFSEGLEPALATDAKPDGAVKVTIDGIDAKPDGTNLTVSYDKSTLTIDFADILSDHWESYAINPQSVICVHYQAHLTSAARIGMEGNPNEAYLVYTNDPVSEQDGQTNTVVNKIFAYAIDLQKKGSDGKEGLEGAKFALKPQGEELYVQQDGSLAADPYAFVTNSDGKVRISGIDEGSYTLHETEPPEGYRAIDEDINLTITSERDASGLGMKSMGAELSGSNAKVESVDASSAVAKVSVTDEPLTPGVERLAQTGGGPAAAVLTGGGLTLLLLSHASGPRTHRKRYRRRH